MKSEKQKTLENLGFAASYLMYHWVYENNNGGEKNAYLSVKRLLETSNDLLKLEGLKLDISLAIKNWDAMVEDIDKKYPIENSLPEIYAFCKILINILDEIILENK